MIRTAQGNIFANEAHRDFFESYAKGDSDVYRRALVYTLGICEDTRRHFSELYNIDKQSIKPGAVNAGWQTSGSVRVTKLAFNLFTDNIVTANREGREDYRECQQYSVSDIFCCEYAPYFVEAVKIRYPEFFR